MLRSPRLMLLVAVLLSLVPLGLGAYPRYIATLWLIYAISAVGLNIPIGLASIYSFGHGAFMLIGAYVSGIAILNGSPLFVAMLLSMLCALAVSALLGLPSLRLSGFGLAIVTFGAASVLFHLVKAFDITGGPQGLFLPPMQLTKLYDGRVFYVVVLALFGLAWVVAQCVANGRIGRSLRAISANPIMAQSTGINLLKFRTLAFMLSAAYGAVAGSFLAVSTGYVAPEAYSPELSISIFAAVMIGGSAKFWGPVVGALFIVLIPELTQDTQNAGAIIYALLFTIVATLYPEGLQGLLSRLRPSLQRSASA